MRISWLDSKDLIENEIMQLKLEGKNVDNLALEWASMKQKEGNEKGIIDFKNFLYKNYNQQAFFIEERGKLKSFIDDVNKLLNNQYDIYRFSDSVIYNKLYGGWVGRAAGCLLGKPIEKYSRAVIKEILSASYQWPLENYISGKNIPGDLLRKYPWNRHSGRESLRENIECMTEDDDLNYTMINLIIAEKFGLNFKTENVAETWLEFLPILSTFTAERVVYFNLTKNISPEYAALVDNPYREWIGALIRADLWGWISPGEPGQAIAIVFRDASLSHSGNGILGAMYVSALLSLAFFIDDTQELIQTAIRFVPKETDLYKAVQYSASVSKEYNEWELISDKLYERYGQLHWVHILNNVSLITAALVYGKNDFEKSICAAVMGGWDTDSNAATVGSILGTIKGYNHLPRKWIAPLNNKIRSSVKGFDFISFDELANRTFKVILTNKSKR